MSATSTPRRNLFVVWHWIDEHHNKSIPVEGDSNAYLYCWSDKMTGDELEDQLSKTAKPDAQNILLLHEKEANPHFKAQDATRERWGKLNYQFQRTFKFSKGEDFIYHRYKDKTGLLLSNGYLTSPNGMYPEMRSVLNNKGDSVLPHYFNEVWDFYAVSAKFHVFDLKENLFIYLSGQQLATYSYALPQLGNQGVHFLKTRHRTFTALESEFEKDSLANAKPYYTALKNHLDTTPLNTNGYLHATGQHFRNLLGAMPGNIH